MVRQVEGRHFEGLKHQFCYFLSNLSWVQEGFSYEHSPVTGFYFQLPFKRILSEFLHVTISYYQSILMGEVQMQAFILIWDFFPTKYFF